jgi:hypothetical protein
MPDYFEKFPLVSYSNTIVRDITARAVVVNSIYNDPALYYPYDIRPYERPDNISSSYYKDEYKDWIIRLTNKVVDPYYDWYLDQETFNAFIIKKYGSISKAQTKYKHYQNNWYSGTNIITAGAYEVLPEDAKRFWEPVPENGQNVLSPKEYSRSRIDWTLATNKIIEFAVLTDASDFIIDEVVDITISGVYCARAQVVFANDTKIKVQHIVEKTALDPFITVPYITLESGFSLITESGEYISSENEDPIISSTSTIVGQESNKIVNFSSFKTISTPIPADESAYWSPVSYYDYETSINERNKSIIVLDSSYSSTISKELQDIMR